MNTKHREWSGRILVNQIDRSPFIGSMIQNAVDYYNRNDGWQHCLARYSDDWICNYEILQSGTMKIVVWKDVTSSSRRQERQ